MEIIKLYTDYAVAYSLYIDKYLPNKDESECQFEIELCDILYKNLEDLVYYTYETDEEKADYIMNTLCMCDPQTKKIDMAKNLLLYFEIIA